MTNPFDWDYLTRVPKGFEAYGPFALAYVACVVLGLIASLVLGRVLAARFREHALHQRLAARATEIAAWFFGLCLLIFGFRALELPFLGMRLWLYLTLLAGLAALGAAVWYWRARYPAALARHRHEQTRQSYLRSQRPARRGAKRGQQVESSDETSERARRPRR